MAHVVRPLRTLEDCLQVVDLEKRVWGYADGEDVVPAAILLVSVKRGGILLGGFDAADPGRIIGFVYSLASFKDGRPAQWSHMLGVLPEARNSGLGAALKQEQRHAALAMGITLIEWTFDPMQALNAHLNFEKLGVLADEYTPNLYGDSSSPLHRGNPTDRFIAAWHLDAPHVLRRLSGDRLRLRESGTLDAPLVLGIRESPAGPRPGPVDPGRLARRVAVEIPVGFSDMLVDDPERALAWRLATRQAFTTYFARAYRAVDFFLDRARGRGRYLLAQSYPA